MSVKFDRREAALYLDTLFRGQEGFLWLGWKPRSGSFTERSMTWPDDRDPLLAMAKYHTDKGSDVFVTPTLAKPGGHRRKEVALRRPQPAHVAWCDVDESSPELSKRLAELGPCVLLVESGGPGRLHIYVPLALPVIGTGIESLNRRLVAHLGGDPSPTWHGSYMRLPGTLNFKYGEPVEVRLLCDPPERVMDLDELDAVLPEAASVARVPATMGAPVARREVTEAEMPPWLREELDEELTEGLDRSKRHFHAVGACARAGLDDGQILEMIREHGPSVDKWGDGERLDRETMRAIGKIRAADPEAITNEEVLDLFSGAFEPDKTGTRVESAAPVPTPHLASVERTRLSPGGDWILDEPEVVPALWGTGQQVLMAEGEATLLGGGQGLGKTTIAQEFCLARLGIRPPSFLGLEVQVSERPIVYLAMDRPRQAARSFRRMVDEPHRDRLNQTLAVWKGPLLVEILRSPTAAARAVLRLQPNVGLIVVDSVKDLAPGISQDEVGAALNMFWQEIIANGVEVLLLHHQRKRAAGASTEETLDSIYGSNWLTAGCGSVLLLEGEPGDPLVKMRHVKQPAEVVGPLDIRRDHGTGTSTLFEPVSILDALAAAGSYGMTKAELAMAVHAKDDEAAQKRVERQLKSLQDDGCVVPIKGGSSRSGRIPDRWVISALCS